MTSTATLSTKMSVSGLFSTSFVSSKESICGLLHISLDMILPLRSIVRAICVHFSKIFRLNGLQDIIRGCICGLWNHDRTCLRNKRRSIKLWGTSCPSNYSSYVTSSSHILLYLHVPVPLLPFVVYQFVQTLSENLNRFLIWSCVALLRLIKKTKRSFLVSY